MYSMYRIGAICILFFLALQNSLGQILFIEPRTKVEVLFPDKGIMLPRQWTLKKISPEIQPISLNEKSRMEEILVRAFSKYPVELLSIFLDRVYVFKSMKFYGLPYGGTNFLHDVYLSDDSDNPNFTDKYIEQVFHHEFSSILIRDFPDYFNKAAWLSLNPPAFNYGKGGAEAIYNGQSSMELDTDLAEKGFLSQYSLASMEEDINVFAQNIFTGGRDFWRLVDLEDSIREKMLLLIDFYHNINPVFTESYFRSLYFNTAQR